MSYDSGKFLLKTIRAEQGKCESFAEWGRYFGDSRHR